LPAVAALAAFIAAAAWIFFRGEEHASTHSPSLAQSLQEKDIESAFGMTADLEPGMLLRMGSLDVVALPKDAFEHPDLLHVQTKENWISSGTYEDEIDGQAAVEMDILSYLGISGSKAELTSEHVAKVVANIEEVQAASLTESDIMNAGIKKQFAEQLASDKAVVVVQSVVRAKKLTLSFQDKNSQVAKGELPKAAIPASVSTSTSKSTDGHEVYSQAVLGFKQCLWLNPADLAASAADKVADNVAAKGYAATTGRNGLLVQVTRATAPRVIEAARETLAVQVGTVSHAPVPEIEAAKERETVAFKKLPARKTPLPSTVLRKRVE
jgi:hypothetical protein